MPPPKNCVLRGTTYHFRLTVPPDIRSLIGRNVISESLDTGDPRRAEALAGAKRLEWRDLFKAARRGEYNVLNLEKPNLLELKSELTRAQLGHTKKDEAIQMAIVELLENRAYNFKPEEIEAVTGQSILFEMYLDNFKDNLTLEGKEAKTIDEQIACVERFISTHPTDKNLSTENLRNYLNSLRGRNPESQASVRTQNKNKTYIKKFLEFSGATTASTNISKIKFNLKKTKKTNKFEHYTDAEIQRLIQASIAKADHELKILITLGMYTGARIEELCSIKKQQQDTVGFLRVPSAKSFEIRYVPIHDNIKQLVEDLWSGSKDEYLIPNQKSDKYGDRSGALGKRFGRLKSNLQFGSRHGFHSLRGTFIQKLREQGVREEIVADIVGHEHQTMTFGHYGNKVVLKMMNDAIKNLHYVIE